MGHNRPMPITTTTEALRPHLYYHNILNDVADAVDAELLLDELLMFISAEHAALFIEQMREVADIEYLLPKDFPGTDTSYEALPN
jgi:hypothetical protein